MANIETLLDALIQHFNVTNLSELAIKLNTTPQNISKWKARNSINAIKKKCRELGIYNEIFGDQNVQNNNLKYATITNGAAGVDNSNKKKVSLNENAITSYAPDFVIKELDFLFERCGKERKDELLDAFDEFIMQQKKKCRN